MATRAIRETTRLSPPSPTSRRATSKPGGTPLREVTRLEEPRTKPSASSPKASAKR